MKYVETVYGFTGWKLLIMLDNEMDKLTCSVNSKSLKHCPVEQTIAENEWHSTSDILEHDRNNFDSEEGCLISMLSLYFSRQKHYGVKKRSPFWNWCRTNSVSKVKWSKIIIFVLCHLASVLSQGKKIISHTYVCVCMR